MSIKLEKVVQTFYDSLEEGKILGRKCPVCGNVEFPPVYACNACGNYETEWVEIVQTGNAILADADGSRIMDAWQHFKNNPPTTFPEIFGDGHAAEFMLKQMLLANSNK